MKIGILGCGGKVGKQLIKALYYKDPTALGGCLESSDSSLLGQDIGNILNIGPLGLNVTNNTKEVFSSCDVLIDFTNATAAIENIQLAAKYKKPIVVGTTGFNDGQERIIKNLSKQIAIVKSSNMSLGVNILFNLVECAAKILNKELYDVEIIEKHHKNKKDAPSGTALTLGTLVAKARKEDLKNIIHSPRKGITGGREPNKIAFHVIRGGDLVGEHSVLFIGEGETLELKHTAINRDIFVNGAIKAAKWIVGKPSGFYSFGEIINQLNQE